MIKMSKELISMKSITNYTSTFKTLELIKSVTTQKNLFFIYNHQCLEDFTIIMTLRRINFITP